MLGNIELVKLLADTLGADITPKTLLMHLTVTELDDFKVAVMIKLFIKLGADRNARSKNDMTPLGWEKAYEATR